jgi:hypothetical protein
MARLLLLLSIVVFVCSTSTYALTTRWMQSYFPDNWILSHQMCAHHQDIAIDVGGFQGTVYNVGNMGSLEQKVARSTSLPLERFEILPADILESTTPYVGVRELSTGALNEVWTFSMALDQISCYCSPVV